MSFQIQPGQRIAFLGDSITCASRLVGTGDLGHGYVSAIDGLISAKFPAHKLKLINVGIDGDTARSLAARLNNDVIAQDPSWVSIMVGINDLSRWMRDPTSEPGGVEQYEKTLDSIVADILRLTSARVVLLDPFFIADGRNPSPEHARTLQLLEFYVESVSRVAERHSTLHMRTHAAFQRELLLRPASDLCPEPIHPNAAGHAIIARAWMAALGE